MRDRESEDTESRGGQEREREKTGGVPDAERVYPVSGETGGWERSFRQQDTSEDTEPGDEDADSGETGEHRDKMSGEQLQRGDEESSDPGSDQSAEGGVRGFNFKFNHHDNKTIKKRGVPSELTVS